MSEPVDLPEHGESGLVFVLIFEDLRYYCRVHSVFKLERTKYTAHGRRYQMLLDGDFA